MQNKRQKKNAEEDTGKGWTKKKEEEKKTGGQ